LNEVRVLDDPHLVPLLEQAIELQLNEREAAACSSV
jgi:hypothetical protein